LVLLAAFDYSPAGSQRGFAQAAELTGTTFWRSLPKMGVERRPVSVFAAGLMAVRCNLLLSLLSATFNTMARALCYRVLFSV